MALQIRHLSAISMIRVTKPPGHACTGKLNYNVITDITGKIDISVDLENIWKSTCKILFKREVEITLFL